MSNLFEYFAHRPPAPAALGPLRGRDAEDGIRFEDVGFTLSGRHGGRPATTGRSATSNLFVPPGQSLALVGRERRGQDDAHQAARAASTQPTEGRVLLDGRDLRDWDEARAARGASASSSRTSTSTSSRCARTSAFGSVEHLDDELRVGRAVRAGRRRASWSAALPAGLETQLGRWFAGGVELSGGQWQKIALARAFMREEADILDARRADGRAGRRGRARRLPALPRARRRANDDPDLARFPDGAHGGSHPRARAGARGRGRTTPSSSPPAAATRGCSVSRRPAIDS